LVGYLILIRYEKFLQSREKPHGVDSVSVKVLGLIIFGAAYVTHSGPFLAVFVMGLVFTSTGHTIDGVPHNESVTPGKGDVDIMAEAEKAGNDKIDGILKPLVFATLGAIVDKNLLWEYAHISLILFIAFMVVRVVAVFICMSLSVYISNRKRVRARERGEEVDLVADVTWQDMLFTALCRETGIVPAALLIGAVAEAIPGAPMLTALGMGIILCTLVFCPLYKPWLAKWLKLA
jgi:NhaP-type Na+/H+ or K+/H+ antiporter